MGKVGRHIEHSKVYGRNIPFDPLMVPLLIEQHLAPSSDLSQAKGGKRLMICTIPVMMCISNRIQSQSHYKATPLVVPSGLLADCESFLVCPLGADLLTLNRPLA